MLNQAQQKYLNGVALQELMRLHPDYDESQKRKIYEETVHALCVELTEEYWRLQYQRKGN